MVAFYGTRKTGRTKTIGVRVCGLVACETEKSSTCTTTLDKNRMVNFTEISIREVVSKNVDAFDFPSSLTSSITPVDYESYQFYKKQIGDKFEVRMFTKRRLTNVASFGIYGRVYSNDDKKSGPINGGLGIKSSCFVLMTAGIVALGLNYV